MLASLKLLPLSLVFYYFNGMIKLIVNSDHMLLIRSGMVVNKRRILPFYCTPMPFLFVFKI
jgi:hypothetical protein